MALDAALLQILACPEDKGPLYYLADEDVLYNPRLQRVYDVRDDIPVMLDRRGPRRRRRRGARGCRRRIDAEDASPADASTVVER